MAKLSKRMQEIRSKVDANKSYDALEALELLKSLSSVKFTESVDVAVNLGIDPKKSDQVVRGASTLPNGTGKSVRVAVFAQDANAEAAKEAGADIVGFEDLADSIKGGNLDFDVVIASPDAMRVVGQLGTILGPKGLMPNPKVGTVTADVATAVKNAKGGQVRFRTDKNGIIHASVGNVSFETAKLKENIEFLIADLNKLKPASAKGVFLQKVAVSTTMGPGISVDTSTLEI
ncbi:MAG: 50S ribosomal protein L1 [Gammaproteobacteria bacterium]|nr:MAG: 50S ribosomal protein L1 [Gammaproteobacteria bacterium]